ncbi:hypothetical protein PtA15_2A71 [Puccinia triticina]|uniref:Uncharacterized protein n=1 Tax=Puccinia triticina TaxID=208348 RepID=A0ABY7C9B6_9BASI|nr:uncharacterized protein PtA15_2A71 [Puccinia triticina]WAQ81760.1 hypothetical protein PtA15_2A71 [Puccinia triticina]
MAQDKSLNKAITKSKDLGVKDSINLKLLRLAKGDPGMQDLIDLWLEKNQTRLYNPFLELIIFISAVPHSLPNMMDDPELMLDPQDNLHQQPRDILEQHLPPGFLDNHVDAISSVNSAVKKQLNEPTLPNIPNLAQLSRLIWWHLNPQRSENATDPQVDHAVRDPIICVRFAYLRWATLFNYFDPASRNISQWHQIDTRLIANSELPVSYTNAWHQLLGAQDAALFGHQPSLANLDQSAVQVSTDEEPLRAKRISDPPSPRSVSDGSLPDAPVPS